MEQMENLAKLEEAIDKLLRSRQEMEKEKAHLVDQLAQREWEAADLRQQLETMRGERSKIQQRVAGLIESIEKWEKTTGTKNRAEEAGTKPGEGKTLF